ncbi:MAG: hypothetical protein QM820_30225 [Minicystis sp.]
MATQSPLIVNTTHPGRDFDGIKQLGIKVLNLALTYQAAVESRLPQGVLEGLKEDLGMIGVVVPGALQAHTEAQQATEVRDEAMTRACQRMTAMRKAVRNAHASKAVQHAYGVGQQLDPRRGTTVKSAVTSVLGRLADHPEEAAEFCFLPEDIDALKAVAADVETTSETQHVKRAGAPQTTKERNRVANRILHAGQRIAAAGCLAFANDPAVRALFEAIRVAPAKKKSVKTKKAVKGQAGQSVQTQTGQPAQAAQSTQPAPAQAPAATATAAAPAQSPAAPAQSPSATAAAPAQSPAATPATPAPLDETG